MQATNRTAFSILHHARKALVPGLGLFLLCAFAAAAQTEVIPAKPNQGVIPLPSSIPETVPQQTILKPKPAPAEKKPPAATSALDWRGSLMFSLKDMERLHNALELFESTGGIDIQMDAEDPSGDYLSELANQSSLPKVIKPPFVAPSFYLSSIVYGSAKDWTVWIDGKKIDASGRYSVPNFAVEKISKSEARLSWQPAKSDLDELKPLWNKLLEKEKSGKWKLDAAISYHSDDSVIHMTLRPNQSFASRSLTIMEGKPSAHVVTQSAGVSSPRNNSATEATPPMPSSAPPATETAKAFDSIAESTKREGIDLGPLLGPLKAISGQAGQ